MEDVRVVDVPERSRYEILLDGRSIGWCDYEIDGDRMLFPHAEIKLELRGQGLGERLVDAALEDARTRGLTIVPQCPFVKARFARS